METAPVRQREVERPRSVVIVVVLQIIQSLALFSFGVYRITTLAWPSRVWELSLEVLATVLVQVITSGVGLLVLGSLALLVAWQLFGMKSYAWLMGMSLQGIILLTSLIAYLREEPNHILMAMGVLLVFYLNQNEIQSVMRGSQEEI